MKKNIRMLNLIITYKVIHNAHKQIKSRSPGIGEKANTQCRLVYNSNIVLWGATALYNAILCECNIINQRSHKSALEFSFVAYMVVCLSCTSLTFSFITSRSICFIMTSPSIPIAL